MKRTIQGAIAMAIAFLIASPSYAILYNVNRTVGAGSVTGFISTDGTLGGLTQANILDFSLVVFDGTSSVTLGGLLSGADSTVHFNPDTAANPLNASATTLSFDFGSTGYAHFQRIPIDNGANFYCFTVGGHCGGAGAKEMLRVGAIPNPAIIVSFAGNSSNVAFASASVSEPGTLAILGLGLVGLGVARRKKVA